MELVDRGYKRGYRACLCSSCILADRQFGIEIGCKVREKGTTYITFALVLHLVESWESVMIHFKAMRRTGMGRASGRRAWLADDGSIGVVAELGLVLVLQCQYWSADKVTRHVRHKHTWLGFCQSLFISHCYSLKEGTHAGGHHSWGWACRLAFRIWWSRSIGPRLSTF